MTRRDNIVDKQRSPPNQVLLGLIWPAKNSMTWLWFSWALSPSFQRHLFIQGEEVQTSEGQR